MERLAKEYLGHVQSGYDSEASDVSADGKELDSGIVSDRLRRERLDAQGKYFRSLSLSVGTLDVDKDIEKRTMSAHQVRLFLLFVSTFPFLAVDNLHFFY
jgi:hypothetical protein